jgi:hypothetical protein
MDVQMHKTGVVCHCLCGCLLRVSVPDLRIGLGSGKPPKLSAAA